MTLSYLAGLSEVPKGTMCLSSSQILPSRQALCVLIVFNLGSKNGLCLTVSRSPCVVLAILFGSRAGSVFIVLFYPVFIVDC